MAAQGREPKGAAGRPAGPGALPQRPANALPIGKNLATAPRWYLATHHRRTAQGKDNRSSFKNLPDFSPSATLVVQAFRQVCDGKGVVMVQVGIGASVCRARDDAALGHARLPLAGAPHVVALGGTVTPGRHVALPYPALLEGAVGCPVVNLGAPNAGPDHYLADRTALQRAAQASLSIVEAGGADGVTNPFYSVHSRRNDRFLAATPALRHLFPAVDFTEIHYTRHLLSVLRHADPDRFAVVARTLQDTWLVRMQALLSHLPPRRILLLVRRQVLAGDPAPGPVIDRALIAGLGAELVEVVLPRPEGPPEGVLPDAADHRRIASALLPAVRRLLRLDTLPPLVLGQANRIG